MNERPAAIVRVVTPGYFRMLRIPVVRGRELTEADDASTTSGFVVNEVFAKASSRTSIRSVRSLTVWMQPRTRTFPSSAWSATSAKAPSGTTPQPTVFYSHRQMPEAEMTLFVRANQPTAIATSAVGAIHKLDPNVAVTKVRTFDDAIAESLARERLSALVSGAFALSGLLLAALGLYGLLAFLVTERTKEIGIRIALGAQVGQLTRSVVGGGLRLVAIGAAVGVGGSLVLFRLVGTLLFGVTPYDLSTYATVLALLCAVASVAWYVPARRAGRVEPLIALRQE